jgi:hypothetical protein
MNEDDGCGWQGFTMGLFIVGIIILGVLVST